MSMDYLNVTYIERDCKYFVFCIFVYFILKINITLNNTSTKKKLNKCEASHRWMVQV